MNLARNLESLTYPMSVKDIEVSVQNLLRVCGPIRTEGPNILLHNDDPVAMEYVLAHCYEYDLELPDMDTTLKVYKLADIYFRQFEKRLL